MVVKISAVLFSVLLLAAACGSSDGESQTVPTLAENPTGISGLALPTFDGTVTDPAVGTLAPIVTGTDLLTGEPVSSFESIENAKPLMIAFYAHWCPHCQAELPQVSDGLNRNPLPDAVDFIAVSTFEDANRGNHPPAAWFRREEWRLPTISDTRGSAVAEVFGVQSVPFLVLVDIEGNVAARVPGSLGPNSLHLLATQLIEGVTADVETGPSSSS